MLLRLPVPADVAARVEVPRGPEEHRMYDRSGEPKVFTQAEVEGRLAEVTGQDLAVARRFAIAALV